MVFLSFLRLSEPLLNSSLIVRPLFDRVFVQRLAPKNQTAGGIMLPEKETSKYFQGIVIDVGPGVRTETGVTIPMQLKAGDHVILPPHGGQHVNLDGLQFYSYREADIVGVIKQ